MKQGSVTKVEDVKDISDVSSFLFGKFRDTGYTTITDWLKGERLDISHETASSIMLRGRKCGLMSFLQLGIALELTNTELVHILKVIFKDNLIWRRLEKVSLSSKSQTLLEKFNKLNEKQQELIFNMIGNMEA